jgi:spermidine synthase/MFS family permease
VYLSTNVVILINWGTRYLPILWLAASLKRHFKNMTAILCVIFFLSGASALIFELLWFQLAGITFGNSVWASALVLSSFMGGLALGSTLVAFQGHKIQFPIRIYAFLEMIIAISGFSLVLIFPKLTPFLVPIYRPLLDHSFILNSLKAMIAFCLMVVPAAAMGATLPVLVKALYSRNPGFGRVLGILYGWNTLGAVAGVIIGEFYLIKLFGIKGAGLWAASFNLCAAATAIWLYKKNTRKNTAKNKKEVEKPFALFRFSNKTFRLLLASFFSGLTLLALEVIWFRFLLLFFSATSRNFAIMLAAVLLGISLGGLIASKWFRLQENAHRFLLPVLIFNGILIVLLYANFKYIYNIFKGYGIDGQLVSTSLFLIFPISLVSGIVFTMLGKALHNEIKSETKASGLLTLANTFGGMLGSLIAGLIFIPGIGVEKSFFVLAISYGVIAFLVYERKQFILLKKKLPAHHLAIGIYLVCMMLFPFGFMEYHYLKIPYDRYKSKGERRVLIREGVTETIQYLQKDLLNRPYYHRLVTNNHSMSATTLNARRYMKLFVYWAAAVHPGIKDALLICYGCGMTAKALTDTKSLKNIEVVDISRDIIMESSVIFPDPKENPINDPRVNVHVEDGRFFLLTRQRTFDLITAEPPPPNMSGIVNLYTQEYFQLIHDSLSEGGIVTYWLPVYQLSVSESKSIVKGFCNVFKECSLWAGSGLEWMLVGIKNPGKPVSEKDFIRQWNDPIVGSEMRAVGFESPEQFGAFFIADGQRLRNWIWENLPLTDNYPKRLSSYIKDRSVDVDINTYIDFMDDAASKANFMNSSGIKKMWPESLCKRTEMYFPTARIINEILFPKTNWRRFSDVIYLHKCIHDPLLESYIPWLLNSNQDAQKIISSILKENPGKSIKGPEIYIHLAAEALQKKNYLLAEDYLRLAVDQYSRWSLKNDYSYFKYCTIRMYLLFMKGNIEGAKQVGQEYVNFIGIKKGEAEKVEISVKIEGYLNWLAHNI